MPNALTALLALLALFGQAETRNSAGVWLEIPFIKQTEEGCGSASLAMVLKYWSAHGVNISAERADAAAIQRQLYSRKAHGIFASDMERYIRESGLREFAVRGEWGDLREHLEKGRPVIVSIQPGAARVPFHYVVVAGMDWRQDAVFLHDPARGKLLRVERPEFEKEWNAARNWMLLVLPAAAR